MDLQGFAITKREVIGALGRYGDTLDDYESTVFGLIWDGVEWEVFEDSLTPEEALEWAQRAAEYGEHVGLYHWEGTH